MGKIGTISFKGASGREYEFGVYTWGTSFKEVGAVYVVTSRTPKPDGTGTHDQIYVGQTSDLSRRFDNHHKQACFDAYGANCVCVHVEESEQRRLNIEADLLDRHSPPCND